MPYQIANNIPTSIVAKNLSTNNDNITTNESMLSSKIVNNYNTTNNYTFFIQNSKAFNNKVTIKNKLLGEGIQGVVMQGYIKQSLFHRKKVAIKTIESKSSIRGFSANQPPDIARQQIIDEIQALRILKNANNIVKILAAFEEKVDNFFKIHIVMELADISLKDYRKLASTQNIIISEANVNFVMKQCLSVVSFCKAYNIPYFDIHAGNFLIFYKQNKIKLCDFGYLPKIYPANPFTLMSKKIVSEVIKFINGSELENNIFAQTIRNVKNNMFRKNKISSEEIYNDDYTVECTKHLAILLNYNIKLARILVYAEQECHYDKSILLADKIIALENAQSVCTPLPILKKLK